MKKPIYILIIIIIIIAGAYAINRYSGKGEAQSEGTTVAEDEYVTHTSKEFSFEYPRNWFVRDIQEGFTSYVSIANFDPNALSNTPHAQGNYYGIEIVKLENSERFIIDEWVENFMKNSESQPTLLSKEKIIIDDNEAIRTTERVQGVEHPAIYVSRKGSVYIINISHRFKDFEPILNRFLESFYFLNSN